MAQSVKVVDKGWGNIAKWMKTLGDGRTASVGIQGDKAAEDHGALTNAELGAIHEYGTKDGHIPERSFLRSTEAENESWIADQLKKIASDKVFEGKDPEGSLKMMGEEFRTKVLEKIKSNIPPELADSTKAAKKGEPTALISSGQFWNSITSEVVDSREKQQ